MSMYRAISKLKTNMLETWKNHTISTRNNKQILKQTIMIIVLLIIWDTLVFKAEIYTMKFRKQWYNNNSKKIRPIIPHMWTWYCRFKFWDYSVKAHLIFLMIIIVIIIITFLYDKGTEFRRIFVRTFHSLSETIVSPLSIFKKGYFKTSQNSKP